MLVAALTGGIGSGKSTVADLFVKRGALLVDSDAIAREIVEPGQPALAKLVERFGPEILDPDGRLDRARLADVAFTDDQARADLEAITHPAIGAEYTRRLQDAPSDAVVICDIPLLAESAAARERGYDLVIVVEAPPDVRLARLEQRGVPRPDAERRMAAQATDEERRALATYLIDNAGDRAALERRVDEVWQDLEAKSRAAASTAGPPPSD
jgi:dephospho-CoA kinase